MDERPGGVSWSQALSDAGFDEDGGTPGGEVTSPGAVEGPATTGDVPDDPEQLRAQIEQTRAEMSETINAIQERLDPEKLKEQAKEQVDDLADQAKEKLKETVQETVQTAKDAVYEATIGKAGNIMRNVGETISDVTEPAVEAAGRVAETVRDRGSSIVRTVRRNPLPAALIGIGLGMLLMDRWQRRSYDYYDDYDDGADWGYEGARAMRQGQSTGVIGRAQSAVGDFVGSAQETASNAADQVRDQVSSFASQTAEQVSNLGGQVQERARWAQSRYQQSLQENPLAVGAVALALGAAAGLMLPSTRTEDEWMGEARENLVQVAQEAARDTIEKVQQVAGEAGRVARKEAEYQGLTGGS